MLGGHGPCRGKTDDGCRLASIRRVVIIMDVIKGCLVGGGRELDYHQA